jgi:PAS domain S-box-containing protein
MPPTPVNDAARPSGPPTPLWHRAGGPLLTLATLVGLLALAPTPWRIPEPAIIYLIPVIYSAYVGGIGPGLVSTALSLVFALLFFSRPGHPFEYSDEDLRRLVTLVIATPAVTLMTGVLKRRQQRRSSVEGAALAGERYRELVDDIDGIVWEADPRTFRFSFVSRRAADLVGYPPERWLAEPDFWASHIHPEDRERTVALRTAAVERGEDHTFDYRMTAADGRTVWLRDRVRVVKGRDGRVARLRGVMIDITASVEAERALRSSEARKGAIVESALDCIVTIDHRGNITDFNPAAERTFGYRRADAIGQSMAELIVPPALRQRLHDGLAHHLASGEVRMLGQRIETTAMRADGSELPVELTISRIPGSDPPAFTGFLRDITERKRVEDELRGTLSLHTATLESTTDGILVVDREGRIVSLNRRFTAMWRIPQNIIDSRDDDRAIGFVLSQLRDPEAFVAKVRELYAQPEAESFDVLEFKDGRVFERYSMPQRIEGRSVGRVWSFRDVTERRRAEGALRDSEEQLRQSQKMDAIGRLAGGVAHDFNNLLTVILGYTEQLLEQLKSPADDAMRRAVGEIQGAAERASALTGQLLAFSRKQMLEPKELDLNVVLTGTSRMLRRLIGEDIDLEVKLAPDLGRVLADANQIQQVVMNLAINARDAMPNGGRLTFTTANVELDAGYAQQHVPLAPGRYAMLTVSDTGVGMAPETRARVFEPFFTTKERGKGTGLGLATVYGIVKQTGGYIWLHSEPGQGTVFKIYLPRLESSTSPEGEPATSGRSLSGTETVLLVEDEPMVRDLLGGMLEKRGYRVLTAGSGEEAVEIAVGDRGPIHLMVTDVVMSGMGGPELAKRLAPLHPELRVLYVSGYTDDAVLRLGVREGLTSFLQKPFTLDALARKIRDVLDTQQPA